MTTTYIVTATRNSPDLRDGLVLEEQRTYRIRDDAGSRDIQAVSADDACAMYATIEGLRARTMADLTDEIEAQGGYVYIHEAGVLLYQTAGVHG